MKGSDKSLMIETGPFLVGQERSKLLSAQSGERGAPHSQVAPSRGNGFGDLLKSFSALGKGWGQAAFQTTFPVAAVGGMGSGGRPHHVEQMTKKNIERGDASSESDRIRSRGQERQLMKRLMQAKHSDRLSRSDKETSVTKNSSATKQSEHAGITRETVLDFLARLELWLAQMNAGTGTANINGAEGKGLGGLENMSVQDLMTKGEALWQEFLDLQELLATVPSMGNGFAAFAESLLGGSSEEAGITRSANMLMTDVGGGEHEGHPRGDALKQFFASTQVPEALTTKELNALGEQAMKLFDALVALGKEQGALKNDFQAVLLEAYSGAGSRLGQDQEDAFAPRSLSHRDGLHGRPLHSQGNTANNAQSTLQGLEQPSYGSFNGSGKGSSSGQADPGFSQGGSTRGGAMMASAWSEGAAMLSGRGAFFNVATASPSNGGISGFYGLGNASSPVHAASGTGAPLSEAFLGRMTPSAFLEQISGPIKSGIVGGREVMTLKLTPAKLGEVSVLMKRSGGAKSEISVRLIVESSIIKSLVEEQLSEFKAQISNENIDIRSIEVVLDEQRGGNVAQDRHSGSHEDQELGTGEPRSTLEEKNQKTSFASSQKMILSDHAEMISLVV